VVGLLRRIARLQQLPRGLFDAMNLILTEVRGLYDVLSSVQESVAAVDRRVRHGSREGGELSDEAIAFLLKQRVAMAKSAEHDAWMRETLAKTADQIERTHRDIDEMRRQLAQLQVALDRGELASSQSSARSG